jgi:DNA ligase (NAD+)
MENERIIELRNILRLANKAYRLGEPIMEDPEYDALEDELKELSPDDTYFKETYIEDTDERKQKLPYVMASLNKVKTLEEIKKWMSLKGIPADTELVLTPKYDGLSLCVIENKEQAWTGGQDGIHGRRSDSHFQLIVRRNEPAKEFNVGDLKTIGEVIMAKDVFAKKYAKDFKNPRNYVGGLINSDDPTEPLKDTFYIRYSTNATTLDKTKQLDLCNALNVIKVPFEVITIDRITEAYLKVLYLGWREHFDIDGIVIDVNNAELRNKLGRETSSENPCFARAYKGHDFEEAKDTKVLGVTWKVSKQGLLKPTVQIEPVELDGATVSNPTGNNAKFIVLMGIGTGANIRIKRSGQVIPLIMKVNEKATVELPKTCPSCGDPVEWNENEIELVCINPDCEAQALQRIVAFFGILAVDNLGEGVCTQLYNAGYNTIEKILKLSVSDMAKIPGFAHKKSETLYRNIQKSTTNVVLSKLQHASGCFRTLGSKKLALVEHFGYQGSPTVAEIVSINGFAEKSALAYLHGLVKFRNFLENLTMITITKKEEVKVEGDKCKGWAVVFTGFRDAILELDVIQNGGAVVSSVSKKTTHLIMKEKGSGSSKEQKAIDLGVTIWAAEELKNYLTK